MSFNQHLKVEYNLNLTKGLLKVCKTTTAVNDVPVHFFSGAVEVCLFEVFVTLTLTSGFCEVKSFLKVEDQDMNIG